MDVPRSQPVTSVYLLDSEASKAPESESDEAQDASEVDEPLDYHGAMGQPGKNPRVILDIGASLQSKEWLF